MPSLTTATRRKAWIWISTMLAIVSSPQLVSARYGHRGANGHGLFRTFHAGGPVFPSPASEPSAPRLKRFYDSTGRWTGDGVDTMSSAPDQATVHYVFPKAYR